jgi:ubiquinone/menaquinone biosynthesis C-methylase UbiE
MNSQLPSNGATESPELDSSPKPNFDPIARPYRWLEYLTFGPYLEHCRFHYLEQLSSHRRALILGDGDGRFTARLLAANPQITVDAVDSSATMLWLLEQRVFRLGQPARKRLRTIHSDALAFKPETAGYDLVATHFFLDCLGIQELATLIANLKPSLAPNATWLISEFAIPTRQPTAAFARLLIATLYRAFRILTGLKTQSLPDYASVFRRNGLSQTSEKSFLGGLLVTQLWSLGSSPKN